MDNSKNDGSETIPVNVTSSTTTGQAMDVIAPDVVSATPESNPVATEAPTENSAPEAWESSEQVAGATDNSVTESPSTDYSSEVSSATDSVVEDTSFGGSSSTSYGTAEDSSAEPASDETGGTVEAPVQPIVQHDKGGVPVVAVIVAIIVALGIAGLVLFTYMKSHRSVAKKANNTGSQSVAAKPQASVSDVDATNKTIDDSLLKADDNTDFSTASLSDASLGL